MADYAFKTEENQTIAREMLLLYLNTGTAEAPVWSLIGHRVEDSSMELDWQLETHTDIIGATRNNMKKPIITQSFEPWDLTNGDAAQKKIWQLAFVEQNAQALSNLDLLLEHRYAGFAERYNSSAVAVTGLGGAGGGNIGMPINVTFGGARTVGTVTAANGGVAFKEETAA